MLSLVTGETLTDENLSKGCTTRMLNNSRSDSRVRVGCIFLRTIGAWEDAIAFTGLVEGILWIILFVLKISKFFFG